MGVQITNGALGAQIDQIKCVFLAKRFVLGEEDGCLRISENKVIFPGSSEEYKCKIKVLISSKVFSGILAVVTLLLRKREECLSSERGQENLLECSALQNNESKFLHSQVRKNQEKISTENWQILFKQEKKENQMMTASFSSLFYLLYKPDNSCVKMQTPEETESHFLLILTFIAPSTHI